tara:strand:+ start:543 stop:842 length:300 start_codon:yes stop_codon:yes gene_type:complete
MSGKMRITKRQLRRIIKEEKRKLLREGQTQEEDLFNALDQYVMVLDEEMGYDVPRDELKAEVLNFVDGYFEQTEEPPGGWDEADQEYITLRTPDGRPIE